MKTFHSRIVHGPCRPSWSALSALVLAAGAILWSGAPATAVVGCSTVVIDNDAAFTDADGFTLSKSFDNSTRADNEVAVNIAGDALLIGQPNVKPVQDRLYLWPDRLLRGGDTVLCATSTKTLKANGVFHNPSINDAVTTRLAFRGFFSGGGHGVFVRDSILPTGARCTGDTDPALALGEVFLSFPALSRINNNAQIAFIGITDQQPARVFLYDALSDTLSIVMASGDSAAITKNGAVTRQVCDFAAVGLGDSEVVVRGTTAPFPGSCATDAVHAVFYTDATSTPSIIEIAKAGDPSPIAGLNYGDVFPGRNVFMNASSTPGHMIFEARAVGAENKVCLFLHDPAGPSTTKVACQKDAALGGTLGIPVGFQLADTTNKVCYIADVNSSVTTKQGVFCDGSSVLTLGSSAPAPFASFMHFFDLGMSADGSKLILDLTGKDVAKKGRRGVVSCP